LPLVMQRVEAVRKFREGSKAASTRRLASKPTLFAQIAHRDLPYLLVPGLSPPRRPYVPIGFMPKEAIASNLVQMVPNASPYEFGIITSAMHMAWVRQFAGRLKSDYRYSKDIVYNNFPFPPDASDVQREAVADAGKAVLDVRRAFPSSTLAELYDPTTMPPELVSAHALVDRAVDRCYRAKPFVSERERVEYLFNLHQRLEAPLAHEGLGASRRSGRCRKSGQES
jgi:hypothetical protein